MLVVELSHGVDLSDDGGDPQWKDLTGAQLNEVAELFASDPSLGPLLYQVDKSSPSPNFWDLTPANVRAPSTLLPNGAKVFLFAGADTATTTSTGPVFLKTSSASYYNSWDDAQKASDPATLISDLTTSLDSNLKTPQPFLLSYHCTGAVGGSSLEELAGQLDPMLMDSLATWYSSGAISNSEKRVPVIVTADYISKTDLTMLDTTIGMNFGRWYGFLSGLPGSSQSCTQGPAMAWLNNTYYAAFAARTTTIRSTSWARRTPSVGKPAAVADGGEPAVPGPVRMRRYAPDRLDRHRRFAHDQLQRPGHRRHHHRGHPHRSPEGTAADHSPALTWLDSTLYVAWTGTDNYHYLNVMWSTNNGQTFSSPKQITEESADTPALCVLNGTLWLVWKGTDNGGSLNMAPLQRNGVAVTGIGSKPRPGRTPNTARRRS